MNHQNREEGAKLEYLGGRRWKEKGAELGEPIDGMAGAVVLEAVDVVSASLTWPSSNGQCWTSTLTWV